MKQSQFNVGILQKASLLVCCVKNSSDVGISLGVGLKSWTINLSLTSSAECAGLPRGVKDLFLHNPTHECTQ